MTSGNAYLESGDSTTTWIDYSETPFPLLKDTEPLSFYDTPTITPYNSIYTRHIELKRKILEYRAKY